MNSRSIIGHGTISIELTCVVLRSSLSTSACLMFWWIGASTVAIKRVPMFIPQAPIASAAASCLPLAHPPEATKGMLSLAPAFASSTQFPTSSSPGCPPQSKPSMEMMSAPCLAAESACLMATHL